MKFYFGQVVYGWRMWGCTWRKGSRFFGISSAPVATIAEAELLQFARDLAARQRPPDHEINAIVSANWQKYMD